KKIGFFSLPKKTILEDFSMITADLLAPVKDAVLQAVPSILPVGAAVLGASLAVRFAVSTLKKFF
ncbi:TPA: hypothetical protein ACL0AC_002086, partial [Streptococcus pneumoniae]